MAEPIEDRRPHLLDRRAGVGLAELGERRDPDLGEPLDVGAPDPGDERQVVVVAPSACRARGSRRSRSGRPGTGRCRCRSRSRRRTALDAPVVRVVVARAELLALAEAVVECIAAGAAPGDPLDLLGVEAELEHVLRLRRPRELRVDDLVRAVGLALDEVGAPAPAVVLERRLVDDVGPVAQRLLRRAHRDVPVAVERDLDDVAPGSAKRLEVRGLVLLALPADEVGVRADPVRLVELAARDRELERVRCAQARNALRSEGEQVRRPSRSCISFIVGRSPPSSYTGAWREGRSARSPNPYARHAAPRR